MSAEISAALLFEAGPCYCCDCCAGYCPAGDLPEKDRWDALFSFRAAGVEYVGDRRLMIRRDALVGIPDDVPVIDTKMSDPAWATIPKVKPEPFVGKHTALHFDRLDLADLECRGSGKVVHVYGGDDFLGWSTVASPDSQAAITAVELDVVRRVSIAAHIDINAAAVVLSVAREQS